MIAYLSGKPLFSSTGLILLTPTGVGYSVHITSTTTSKLHSLETVSVYIYSHIKEDAFELFGFLTEDEKLLFLKLLGVDGVGPKTALAIMDRGVAAILAAVTSADVSFFQSVPRVGKKSAQKIIIELKGKLGGQELTLTEPQGKAREVVDALVSLGFSETESQRVLNELPDLENTRLEDVVKAGIKRLTNKL